MQPTSWSVPKRDKTTQMKQEVKEALRILATEIIAGNAKDPKALAEQARKLYEKLIVLSYLEDHQAQEPPVAQTPAPAEPPVNGADKDAVESVLRELLGTPATIKNDSDTVTPEHFVSKQEDAKEEPVSLNDRLAASQVTIGLNDRLAFVKHLFQDSTDDYNRVLSQLNTFGSHEESVRFLEDLVKPEYDNWDGKDEYVARFMQFVERRFVKT